MFAGGSEKQRKIKGNLCQLSVPIWRKTGGGGNASGYESICQFEFLTPLFTYESWLSKFF